MYTRLISSKALWYGVTTFICIQFRKRSQSFTRDINTDNKYYVLLILFTLLYSEYFPSTTVTKLWKHYNNIYEFNELFLYALYIKQSNCLFDMLRIVFIFFIWQKPISLLHFYDYCYLKLKIADFHHRF